MYEASLKASANVPGVDIELVDYRWPKDHRATQQVDGHILSLSLSPMPTSSRGRLEGTGKQLGRLGEVVFMPARISFDAGCDGGPQRILRCRFSESRFRTLTGHRGEWSRGDLTGSINLQNPRLRGGLERLADELTDPGFASEVILESLVEMLGVDLMRHFGRSRSTETGLYSRGGLTPRQLRQIEDRIAERDLPLPTVTELAGELGLSSRHLLRGFRQVTGSTLRVHLQNASRSRAEYLLRNTDLPIKVIAHRLGFRSQGSFSTAFREATGESPRDYRFRTQ